MTINLRSISVCTLALAAVALATVSGSRAQERLIFTSLSPAGSSNSVFFNAWAQRVNEQSNGALKIEVRDGVTLANYGNVYERVQDDVVQIVRGLHEEGLGIIVVSTEPETVLALADRILVMKKGEIVKEFAAGTVSKDRLLEAA